MELNKDYILNLRDQAAAKRQAYLEMIHQADGAIGILNLLLEQLSTPEQKPEEPNAPNSDSNN